MTTRGREVREATNLGCLARFVRTSAIRPPPSPRQPPATPGGLRPAGNLAYCGARRDQKTGIQAVPNTASAKKSVRQTAKRNAISNWRKRRIKEQSKAVLAAVQAQDVQKAEDELRKACGILDKVACTSTMHRRTAARRKSRLSRTVREMKRG